MTIKNYFGDRAFYKMTLTVALPIMAQNLITNFVSMLDNLMVGALGTEQISGVAIANQLALIFYLAVFGAMSGAGIFTAQYYGKKDDEGIRYTVRFKLVAALTISVGAILVFLLFDEQLIRLFLHASDEGGDLEATLAFGRRYLRLCLWGLVPFALTQVFSGTLRETGNTLSPMLFSLLAVLTNGVFNYLLIFGKFGFPNLGTDGAAVATTLSRFVELAATLLYILVKRKKIPYIHGLLRSFRIPGELFANFLLKSLPLMGNEILWSGGMSMLSIAFSLNGLTVVAAYSIFTTVFQLFSIATMSMGVSIGIIAGKILGSGRHEEAVDTVRKLITFSMLLSVGVGILLFTLGGAVPLLYKTSEASKALATFFIRAEAFIVPLSAFANASYFTVRSGGKTLITFLFDSGMLWLVSVPAAFGLYYAFRPDVHILFPVVQGLEIIKDIVGYILIKKRIWVKTII